MADIRILANNLLGLKEQQVSLSGTVKNSLNVGISGVKIIGYRNRIETEVAFSTYSTSGGAWSVTTNGNLNDKFRVIASDAGREAGIWDDVTGILV